MTSVTVFLRPAHIAGHFCLCDNENVHGEQDAKTSSSFLDPERIVMGFGLKKGDHVADFGAGHGYFALALARAVGRDGKVWAIDVQQNALDVIRLRATALHLLNIEYVRADLEQAGASPLPDHFMDFVLMGNILFQAEQRAEVLREAWRALRAGGRLAIIEWSAPDVARPLGASPIDAMPTSAGNIGSGIIGPPAAERIKKQDAKAIAVQAGFDQDREFAAGPHHYGLLFVKK